MKEIRTMGEALAKDLMRIWKANKLPLEQLEEDAELARISMEGSDAEFEHLIKNGASMEEIKRAELLSTYNHLSYEGYSIALKWLLEEGYDGR